MNSDEVAARLKFKGAKSECPICETTKWALAGGIRPLQLDEQYKTEVITLICAKCGFVRQHEAIALHD